MLKRGFDVVASGAGLVVLSPLFFVIAIAVRLNSRGPVFYRARRVGRHGKEFLLYKFRSMITDADQIGPGITSAQDNRITSVGRFLRRTKLDELPQLINVLRGEMSLVGPRPEDPRYVELYTPEQREILRYRPGITSMASFRYRNEEQRLSGDDWERTYVDQVMPAKLAIDLEYARRANLFTDIWLILRTIISR
jgi:lipopolysaccharide/colanic/teichoic acid biosynthesis glycosyltransferase